MPRELIDKTKVVQFLDDCRLTPSAKSATAAYNHGWCMYWTFKDEEEGKITEAQECSYRLFDAAFPIFESLGLRLEAGKARVGHSVLGGTINREGVSRNSAIKAIEWLDPLPKSDRVACKWLVQAFRGLSESGLTDKEQMDACRRGLSLLHHIVKNWGADDYWTRYEALFYRAAGRSEARRRPKTRSGLLRAEEHLLKSLATFESMSYDGKTNNSVPKALRELCRVYRSRSALLRKTHPRAADSLLDRAEKTLRKSMSLSAANGNPSQWENYHLAKILLDRGNIEAALKECLKAVEHMESGREKFSDEDSRIGYLKGKLGIYDLGVFLALKLGKPELGFELSQRCKARVFIEQLHSRLRQEAESAPQTIPTTKKLSARLDNGELLLDYHMGQHALSIFALSKSGLVARRISTTREAITAKVEQMKGFLRQAQTSGNANLCSLALARIAHDLIEPVAAEIAEASCLHVVPSGPLIDVPFAALPWSDDKPLLERLAVSYLPHASMLLSDACAKPMRKILLALANPTGGLAHAEEEAEEIAAVFPGSKLFVGAEANRQALDHVRHCGLLHIACHGEFLPDDALGSHLILAPGNGNDGLLRVEEILALPLAKLDLAFLSCCKTGQGRHKGCDEVESVHRAFLMAGARSVVVTLWDIEDAVTRRLVTAFYRHLAEGKPKAEALRQAQLAVLKMHPHPYHWAAFKLVGSAV